jgi:hypothetical protein
MPKLDIFCNIEKNVEIDDYIAVRGTNTFLLSDDNENIIARYTGKVLWAGGGSPFPTPPGGYWLARFVKDHKKFGDCFCVESDRECDIFIHQAKQLSYGCFIVNYDSDGYDFYKKLLVMKNNLLVRQNDVQDSRSAQEKEDNPIDYDSMLEELK